MHLYIFLFFCYLTVLPTKNPCSMNYITEVIIYDWVLETYVQVIISLSNEYCNLVSRECLYCKKKKKKK